MEIEVTKAVQRLARSVAGRDRAVLLGLLLSATPFPPSTLIGLLLDLVNLGLIAGGSLNRRELGLVLGAICLAFANFAFLVFLLGFFEHEVLSLWAWLVWLLGRLLGAVAALVLGGPGPGLAGSAGALSHV
ncbi:hypothetical protein AcidC75_21100 [Acidisoma sp. C75]